MSIPNNIQIFGFEIFKEIELELEKVKDVYQYSNNNDSYNAIVELCIAALKKVAENKRQQIETEFTD